MITKNNKYLIVFILILQVSIYKLKAQETIVQIDLNCERFLGDISQLDRTKYFSIHDSGTDTEQAALRNDYNVTGGRQFWGPFARAKQLTGQVGVYPADKAGNNNLREVQKGFVSTHHPRDAFVDGIDVIKAGDWAAEYFLDYVNNGDAQEFIEVMNEPFVHADDFYDGWNVAENNRIKLQMAQMYNEVGKRIHDTPALDNLKVIGYSSAWPSMELNDFGHWNENMKMFMDTAGENMFGFSTHLYDGINVTGQDTKRSGSNSEAILDLIENYSYVKWGIIKPHAITEYGAIEKGYGDNYSDIASAQTLISINHILFNLLDRQDNLVNSIPFITGKATWHINAANNYQPYQAVLWKPTNIGAPTPAGWEYTPRINFYELWKEVKGKRVLNKSNNPDVQTQAFVNGNKMFLALNNLDEVEQTVNLTMLSSLSDLVDVRIKALKIYTNALPEMTDVTTTEAPNDIVLIKDETVVLEYTFSNPVAFDNAIRTKRYYAVNHLQPINANSPIPYSFNNVSLGGGYASLRMSIGRKHNVSKKPIIKINDKIIEVPDNWKGYDQANRDDFFGMIEIPFSSLLLKENNTVTVEFPDNGGRISSLILITEIFDKGSANSTLGLIKSTDNPCPNQNSGIISITPLAAGNFSATVTGNGINKDYSFTDKFNIENLASGTYTVKITSSDNPELLTEYNVIISEPESLNVSSKINTSKKSITYNLSGGKVYNISLNNTLFKTSNSSFELPLVTGNNNIEIKTDADCQGIFKESMFFNDTIVSYPNPFQDDININLGVDKSEHAEVKIYNNVGALILSENTATSNNSIHLNTKSLNEGMYIISVNTKLSSKNIKVFKLKSNE